MAPPTPSLNHSRSCQSPRMQPPGRSTATSAVAMPEPVTPAARPSAGSARLLSFLSSVLAPLLGPLRMRSTALQQYRNRLEWERCCRRSCGVDFLPASEFCKALPSRCQAPPVSRNSIGKLNIQGPEIGMQPCILERNDVGIRIRLVVMRVPVARRRHEDHS